MSRKGFIAVALVLTLCTAGAASALPLGPEAAEAAGIFSGAWDRFMAWIGQVAGGAEDGGLTVLEMDTCHLDPNGACGSRN